MWFNLASVPDAETIAANVVVFCGAIAAAVLGGLSAVKKIREGWTDAFKPPVKPPEPIVTQQQIVGGLLQDAFSSPMIADRLREVTGALEDVQKAICDHRDENRELRHQVERLTDHLKATRP